MSDTEAIWKVRPAAEISERDSVRTKEGEGRVIYISHKYWIGGEQVLRFSATLWKPGKEFVYVTLTNVEDVEIADRELW